MPLSLFLGHKVSILKICLKSRWYVISEFSIFYFYFLPSNTCQKIRTPDKFKGLILFSIDQKYLSFNLAWCHHFVPSQFFCYLLFPGSCEFNSLVLTMSTLFGSVIPGSSKERNAIHVQVSCK